MLYFTFTAGKELFAVDASFIQLIVPSFGVKAAPHMPMNVRGIVEYVGELIPVIDFCLVFKGIPCRERMHARIAVVTNGLEGTKKKLLGIMGEYATDILERDQPLACSETGEYSYIRPALIDESGSIVQLLDVPLFFKHFQDTIRKY